MWTAVPSDCSRDIQELPVAVPGRSIACLSRLAPCRPLPLALVAVSATGGAPIAPPSSGMRTHHRTPRPITKEERGKKIAVIDPVAVPGSFLGGGAPSSPADRCHSLASLYLPLAALGSLPAGGQDRNRTGSLPPCCGCAYLKTPLAHMYFYYLYVPTR